MAFNYQESGSQSNALSQSGTLPWYNSLVQNLLTRGQQASQKPWQVYQGQRVAGFSPDQTAAFANLRGQVGDWAPNINRAGQATGQALGALQGLQSGPYTKGALSAYGQAVGQSKFDPRQQQQFFNPYVSNVVNEISRLGQENLTQNIGNLGSAFSEAGQFGSARNMSAAAEAIARSQREISGAQGNALMQAQTEAGRQYGDWANRGISANQALGQGQMDVGQYLAGLAGQQAGLGQQFAGLAGQQQQLGLADVNAQLAAGQQQQALNQAQLGAGMQKFQEQQQAPWQPLTNYAQLVSGVPTPQQSTSTSTSTTSGWNTNFKRGGLVKLADGGLYDREEDQREEAVSPLARMAALSMAMRGRMMGEIGGSPAFDPLPERGALGSIGEAMMRAAAQGPANWGQLIGRSGTAYFDTENERAKENRDREIMRLKLMESALPELGVGRLGGLGAGGVEKLTQARGKDGSLWQVSSTDRGYMKLLQPGNYATDIARAAANAADRDMEGAQGLSTEERRIERNRLIDEYTKAMSQQYAGLGAVSPGGVEEPVEGAPRVPPAAPGLGSPAAPKSPGGAGMPRGAFDLSAGVDAVRAQINRVSDPVERKAAMDALDRQIAGEQPKPNLLVPTPAEKAEQEKVGGGMGTRFMEIQKSGEESEHRVNMLTSMADLLVGVQTGKLTPAGTDIAAWAQSANNAFGGLTGYTPMTIDKNLGNKEAFKALSNQFALQLRNPAGGAGMPGALSEGDRKFLESMSPSLAMSPEGVQRMLQIYMKLEQRNKDVARLARQYRKSNPRGAFDEGFYDYLREYSEANPLFNENVIEKKAYTGDGTKPPKRGDVVGKYQYIGPPKGDRNNPNNWRLVE